MERQWRNFPPGQRSWRRGRGSEYRLRLREKQKVKRYYGVYERQFTEYFKQAERAKGNTGSILLSLLEARLDNVVHKLGFASSRSKARLTVGQGHIHVNGRKVTIPSRQMKIGDTITVKETDKSKAFIHASLEEIGDQPLQNWLKLDRPKLTAEIIARPTREDVMMPVEEQLIVEFCSR